MTDPVLVEVTRGGVVESRHHGSFVLLAPSGEVEVAAGDESPVYARSSLKPLQAAAMRRAGWRGTVEATALAAASHNGEAVHLDGVRRTLAAAGLAESVLGCPAALPAEPALVDYVAGGGRPAPVCHNCSGKHAGMTATCVAAGWDVDTYLDAAHPLQRAIVSEIESLCGAPVAYSSIDGCGAPAHAVPLVALARAFAAIGSDEPGTPGGDVALAMREHPQLLGGTGRAVSELMDATDGLIAKDGAEGIWAAALPDGRAFAAKVEDGSARALAPLLAAALWHWGHDGPVVRRHAAVEVVGGGSGSRSGAAVTGPGVSGGTVVGEVRWSAELVALLDLPLLD